MKGKALHLKELKKKSFKERRRLKLILLEIKKNDQEFMRRLKDTNS